MLCDRLTFSHKGNLIGIGLIPGLVQAMGMGRASMNVVLQKPGKRTSKNRTICSPPGISVADQHGCGPLLLTAPAKPTSFCFNLSVHLVFIHPFSTMMVSLVLLALVLGPVHELLHGFYFSSCIWSHWLVPPFYNHKCLKGTLLTSKIQ